MSQGKKPRRRKIKGKSLKEVLIKIREKNPNARVTVELPRESLLKAFDSGDLIIDNDGDLSFDINRAIEIADEIDPNKS